MEYRSRAVREGFRMSRDDTVVEWAVRLLTQVLTNIFISGP